MTPEQGDIPSAAAEELNAIRSLIATQKFDDAINGLNSLLSTYPEFALAHNDLGVLYTVKGDASIFLMKEYDEEEIVNVGVGQDITVHDLAEMIKKIVGFQGDIVWDTSKPDGTPRKLMDVTKINALGWKSTISLEEGLTQEYLKYKS